MRSKSKYLLYGLLALGIICFVACSGDSGSEDSGTESDSSRSGSSGYVPPYKRSDTGTVAGTIEAIKLAGAFDVDEESADSEFNGKQMNVNGKVTSKGRNKAGTGYIILQGTGVWDPGLSIECVEASIRLDIDSVNVMQSVTVRGVVQGFMDTIKDLDDQRGLFNSTGKEIQLSGCVLVE